MRIEEYKGSRVEDAHGQEKALSVNKRTKWKRVRKEINQQNIQTALPGVIHQVVRHTPSCKRSIRKNPRTPNSLRTRLKKTSCTASSIAATVITLTSAGTSKTKSMNSSKAECRGEEETAHAHREQGGDIESAENRDRREDSPRNHRAQASPNRRGRREEVDEDSTAVKHRVINMISGGLSGGGETVNARKKHLKQCLAVAGKVINKEKHSPSPTRPQIVWDASDLGDVLPGHDDPLVIQAIIANFGVNRVFIDHGSSADILFLPCFKALGFTVDSLTSVTGELSGFNATTTKPLGVITLRLSLGTPPTSRSADIQFLVLDTPSAYNAILGTRMFAVFEASISHPHLAMKFVARDNKVATVRGDQTIARSCYNISLRPMAKASFNDERALKQGTTSPSERNLGDKSKERDQCFLVEFDARDDPRVEHDRPTPDEALEHVVLGDADHQTTTIGATIDPEMKCKLIKLLKENKDLFAWKPSDMPGINPDVCCHRLSVDPKAKPVSQKKRKFGTDRQRVIDEEVKRLHAAGFIREIKYTTWLSNPVLVKKPNGAWRMCVDYTDLNKVCPKDAYPFLSIDQLVDNASGFKMLSFMDAYSGYNQIPLLEEVQDKTAFITQNANYCYTMMPFGLKNAEATYQRMMNEVFRDLIGNCIEVYIDDMIAKSRTSEQHLVDLQGVFERLRKFNMRLNPSKCAFGVPAGKFLGFMLTERGIEVNPDKCKAVIEMRSPQTIKEVQQLTGRLVALTHFLANSAHKSLPLFGLLKKGTAFRWSEECENAFQEFKRALSCPPVLAKPDDGEMLYLYLVVGTEAIGAALVKESKEGQKPVYFISKVLQGAELRYQEVEKVALTLIFAAQRLRPYFQCHPITVRTNQPIRQVLHKPDLAGRMMSWAIELSEYQITYEPRTAIKAQALTDFIAEMTQLSPPKNQAMGTP
ncbi:uncharacterized protein LOC133309691, partial [Gastrolobium bilobum]|uniref:uncharacterized protein LOC133309691 n=1 Tax=Gastrolobium bilobum TaxID=150636 RepID=UPI002AB0A21B